ncbi:hypothetical protein SMZ63_000885 [Cronobacter sakazakii]|nr:hypothetical protein [Cronobacter sakazakii]ELY2759647.1 hypothetical protein [Cronobacter sakazakii]ELY3996636.1 hypothetical protein [Cronobacter sakazakii]ELY4066614.1 hypothetical protein [Cronobacter sakazakii]ELY4092780.1 hypothetical protein [Cronobacter sakazakii]
MKTVSLQEMYRAANEKTLAIWSKNAGIGEIRKENYYDPVKLALATGIQPTVPVKVSRLLCELQQLTQDDPLANILPAHGLHFTFLPLTLPLYNINEPLPANVEQLTTLWTQFDAKKIIIRNLQLVVLPGQLLLAGIPENPAIALRQSFCEKVLESDWKNELLLRHHGSALPAPFWHSTLLRYNAAFLPATLRQFYLKHQNMDFGDVTGELILARVNYNWTQCYPLRIN